MVDIGAYLPMTIPLPMRSVSDFGLTRVGFSLRKFPPGDKCVA